MKNEYHQPVLLSDCHSCSWGLNGLCNRPLNGNSYLLQGENYIGCLDVAKREAFFVDTFKKIIPIPKSSNQHTIEIPPLIITVTSGMKIPDSLENFVFGISLGKIVTKSGKLRYANVNEIKAKFGIPKKAKIVLIGTGEDYTLEHLWKIQEKEQIFEKIAKMGFYAVTSLTWSVWEEDFPRPDQIRNQHRNYQSYDLLANFGMPCIPFLFLVDDIDFENANKWLLKRPDIHTVAIYARYYRDSTKFYKLLSYLEKIKKYIKRPLKFLIVGVAKADNISLLKKKFQVNFVYGKPFYAALKGGRVCDSNLKYSESDLPKEKLIEVNFIRNYRFCQKDKVKTKKPSKKLFHNGASLHPNF